jgi:hypothetical protein
MVGSIEEAVENAKMVPVDARCRDDVVMLIDVLLSQLEADLL